MNRTIIFDTASKQILAIAQDEDMAHMIAECISYKRNRNAIYGLFQMQLVQPDEVTVYQLAAFYQEAGVDASGRAAR